MSDSMLFAKDADGYHGYVTPILKNGLPRFGLLPVDWGVVVRNPQDTAELFNTFSIDELGGSAIGTYKFDVPSSFLVTHGVGNYFVRTFVNTFKAGGSGAPNILMTYPSILKVTKSDVDDLRNLLNAILGNVV